MRWRTFFLYLFGSRQAILDIAADRRAVWLGLLFVLSAGLAREYDGEDLLHEPWYALIPLAASLGSSLALYLVTYGIVYFKRSSGPTFWFGYRSFLGLFWLTAPLAWLYAVPYERFLSPLEATQANLWTLGVVAVWRVLLMMRVVGVLMGYGAGAVFVVMAFADAVLLTVIAYTPLPIFDIMGGVRLSPQDRMIRETACGVCFLGVVTLPVWGIGALTTWGFLQARGCRPNWPTFTENLEPIRSLSLFAAASVAVWFAVLPFTQPEQILRRSVERDLTGGRIEAALQTMSEHSREEFPPHWDPPPRNRPGQNRPPLLVILEKIADKPPPSWVRDIYLAKLRDSLKSRVIQYGGMRSDWDHSDLMHIRQLLQRLPEGPDFLARLKEEAKDNYNLRKRLEIIDPAYDSRESP